MNNLLGHGVIDYVVVFLFILYSIYAGLTKPHRILYILPASLSFFFFIEIGPRLTPDKLVPAIFIVFTIFNKGIGYFFNNERPKRWLLIVFLLILLSSIIGAVSTSYYANHLKSSFINTRLIIQLIGYTNYILIFIIARKECGNPDGKRRLITSFFATTIILCLYGVYQYYANEFGWPYRGIVYSANKSGFGGFSSAKDLIFRVNSFANEPKRLTYFILIGIIINLKYFQEIRSRIGLLFTALLLVLHFVILWLTYSTSIYFASALFLVFLIYYLFFISFDKKLSTILITVVSISAITLFIKRDYIQRIYSIRVEEQLENDEIRAEVYGQKYLLENPDQFLFGFGPGMYNFVLAKRYPGKAGILNNGTYIVPFNSDIIIFLFDFGFIGLIIMLHPFISIITKRDYQSNSFSIYILLLYCVSIVLSPTATLFYFLGAFEGEFDR